MTRLPEELVLDILTRVPGRELGRCKCVCRFWKSLIGSPPFLPLYRRRNPCIILHRSEGGRLHFQYSPLRHHRTDPDDGFRRLGSLPVGDTVTQLVNGVICSGEVVGDRIPGREQDLQLKVISVCTGQTMQVPQLLPQEDKTWSSYHLGYDPKTRRYKLLRLFFLGYLQLERLKAEIVTLGPTGTVWEWRKLDDDAVGIIRRFARNAPLLSIVLRCRVLMFPGDGVLCWNHDGEGMILFDMNKEVFRWVKLPPDVHRSSIVPRVVLDDDRLAIYLWILPATGLGGFETDDDGYRFECECFVLEDDQGNVWRKNSLEVQAGLSKEPYWIGAANGSPISSSASSILLMNSHSSLHVGRRDVYCCTNGEEIKRYWVGQLPFTMEPFCRSDLSNLVAVHGSHAGLSCLLDSNVLYLSLEDVLNGLV